MESLIQKVLQNDRQASRKLYDQFSKAMYNICLRMLNSEEEALDALQDTFILAFKNLSRLDEPAVFPAWIKKICVNVCLKQIKNRKRMNWSPLDEAPVLINLNDEDEIVDEVEFSGKLDAILEAVNLLPDKYRVVFTLFAIEDYSHEQISEMLGIPNTTCRSQYMRAKQKVIDIIKSNNHYGRSNEKISSGSQI